MKKVGFVISFRDFRDIEYFIPRNILSQKGVKIINISSQKGKALGADGGEVSVDLTPEEFDPENFDGVVFVGGPGMVKELDNERFHQIATKSFEKKKIIGAICIAPALLAKAGILKGKKATVWSDPLNKKPIKILEENGAHYLQQDVVIDGNIITASGPHTAEKFAKSFLKSLKLS